MADTRDPITDQAFTNGAGHIVDGALATEIQTDGTYTYIGEAVPHNGAYASLALHLAAAVWRVQRITTATGSVEWANGNGNFDNVATTMSGLTYL